MAPRVIRGAICFRSPAHAKSLTTKTGGFRITNTFQRKGHLRDSRQAHTSFRAKRGILLRSHKGASKRNVFLERSPLLTRHCFAAISYIYKYRFYSMNNLPGRRQSLGAPKAACNRFS
jgi:hypothetical protein